MKKRLCRALVALTMIMVMLFCASACGGTTDAEETFPETEEESVEKSEETESERESESESEEEAVADTKVADGEYKIYPAFIKTFEINNNVLKIETGDAFEDYEIPTEMAINFEYPLASDVAWIDNVTKVTEEDDWYAWFSFSLESITKAAERYNNGQYEGVYTSGQDFCEKNAVWTFVIKDETVQSISMDLVKDESEETTAESKAETTESVAPSAKKDTTASTPAPAHKHRYTASVTKASSCASEGIMTYTCSCGDSYTENIAANGNHNWKEIYGTVEHPSEGEMRQVQVGTSGDVDICGYCGAEFSSDGNDIINHFRSYVGIDNDHATSNYLVRDGQPIYQEEWIVTKEAWVETVVTGYQCTICGATK